MIMKDIKSDSVRIKTFQGWSLRKMMYKKAAVVPMA